MIIYVLQALSMRSVLAFCWLAIFEMQNDVENSKYKTEFFEEMIQHQHTLGRSKYVASYILNFLILYFYTLTQRLFTMSMYVFYFEQMTLYNYIKLVYVKYK